MELIVKNVYGGDGIELSEKAVKQIAAYEKLGWDKLPVCMAKS